MSLSAGCIGCNFGPDKYEDTFEHVVILWVTNLRHLQVKVEKLEEPSSINKSIPITLGISELIFNLLFLLNYWKKSIS